MNEHAELIARLKEAAEEIGDEDFALAAHVIRALQMQKNAFAEAARGLAADLEQVQTKRRGKNPYKSAYFTGYAEGLRKGFDAGRRAAMGVLEQTASKTGPV